MFLTGKSRFEQTYPCGLWKTLDNQLYQDEDDTIYLVPRNFQTDGYTIPNWIAWLGGSKMEWDTRCSTQHDFECRYHQVIIVELTVAQLKKMKFLKEKNGIIICDNIPKRFLTIKNTTFNETNNRFKRMLEDVGTSSIRANILRAGVNFNIAWLWTKQDFKKTDIYNTIL